jgi:hypothetical protein
MMRELDCEGAPRDLGFDQGREFVSELRAEFDRQPAWHRWRQWIGARTPATAHLTRDLMRHYPQHSETLEGMASGSRVPYAWFAQRLAGKFTATAQPGAEVTAAFAARGELTAGGAFAARSFATTPCVRRSRPEGGFASVELTLPWFASSFAGVNEGGLGVASVALPGGLGGGACAVPAPLLVQDCLARFDGVEGAMDWCCGRPAGGRAVILMVDASGAVAAVEIDGEARRVLPPKDGLVVAGTAGDAADALRAAAPFDHAVAAELLSDRVATIDPDGRRISLRDGSTAATAWFEVTPAG